MRRREFLKCCVASLGAGAVGRRSRSAPARAASIVTVTGSVPTEKLGVTLPHEHVLVDFIGAEKASPERYDADEVFRVALPHLKRAHELGCRALVECTPAYLGRDPALLRRLSKASGVRVLTNTGYYGARRDQHVPAHGFRESADELAARWLSEWKRGIGDTRVRPGLIKIGVDAGKLSDVDRKLVRAAGRTHLKSGLVIAAHTGKATAAFDQLETLREEGVSPRAWIWVHAQAERDLETHVRAAKLGAWVEFDGIGPGHVERHVKLVSNMKANGLLDRVLVSHDAGWYHVGESGGGKFRPYDTLFTGFLPALKKGGFTADEVRQLTVTNPGRAFTIGVRRV